MRSSPAWLHDELLTTPEPNKSLAGLGVVRLRPYQASEAISKGELVEVLAPFSPDPLPVQMVHSGQDRLPMKARAFADWITPRLSDALKQSATLLERCPLNGGQLIVGGWRKESFYLGRLDAAYRSMLVETIGAPGIDAEIQRPTTVQIAVSIRV